MIREDIDTRHYHLGFWQQSGHYCRKQWWSAICTLILYPTSCWRPDEGRIQCTKRQFKLTGFAAHCLLFPVRFSIFPTDFPSGQPITFPAKLKKDITLFSANTLYDLMLLHAILYAMQIKRRNVFSDIHTFFLLNNDVKTCSIIGCNDQRILFFSNVIFN